MLKITIRLFLFLILVMSFSCEEQGLIVNCQDCFTDEPLKAVLEGKLGNGKYYPDVMVKIWEGNLEDSILLVSFSSSATFSKEVAINKKYTITATYYISGKYYTTVDSATPRVKYNKEQCDEPCYFVYDKVLDLRLKYTK